MIMYSPPDKAAAKHIIYLFTAALFIFIFIINQNKAAVNLTFC